MSGKPAREPQDSPTTPQLRFGVAQERELAQSNREFRLYMETVEMLHLTGSAGAQQSGGSPFEFTDASVLALLLSAARHCAMGAAARGLADEQPLTFPTARFLAIAQECAAVGEGDLAQVEKAVSGKKEN